MSAPVCADVLPSLSENIAMSKKILLNKATIAVLEPGKYYDLKQRGLLLHIREDGCARWHYYGWKDNRPYKKAIGRYPDVNVEAARTRAGEIHSTPIVAKPKFPTVGEMVERYSRRCALRELKTDHMEQSYRWNWTCYAKTPINEIGALELLDKHDEIAATRGKAAARRAILAMRTLFNYAIKLQLIDRNPALGVETAIPTKRDVYLDAAEIVIFRAVLADMTPAPRDFFLLALLTGLRKSNIAKMMKKWVSLEDATVIVPAEFSKNGDELVIPLVEEAVEIIRGRMPGDSLYVFPGRHGNGCLADAGTWMTDLRRRMRERGVTKHFTIHDLRRSFATNLTERGAPITVVAKALGHRNISSTPIYARASVETVRKWL